jgi:hypothetical protein
MRLPVVEPGRHPAEEAVEAVAVAGLRHVEARGVGAEAAGRRVVDDEFEFDPRLRGIGIVDPAEGGAVGHALEAAEIAGGGARAARGLGRRAVGAVGVGAARQRRFLRSSDHGDPMLRPVGEGVGDAQRVAAQTLAEARRLHVRARPVGGGARDDPPVDPQGHGDEAAGLLPVGRPADGVAAADVVEAPGDAIRCGVRAPTGAEEAPEEGHGAEGSVFGTAGRAEGGLSLAPSPASRQPQNLARRAKCGDQAAGIPKGIRSGRRARSRRRG